MIVVSTLQSSGKTGGYRIDAEAAAGGHLTATQAGVRRLTPVECERLQGFPDGWTDIQWKGKPAADSRRYAALGDAVTVNVGEWLGVRLMSAVRAKAAA